MERTYTGGCQCGAVKYAIKAEIGEVISCNCSRCGKLGSLLTFVPRNAFRLMSGEGATTEYRFNTHNISHRFCSTCGIQSFSFGNLPDGTEMVAINVRCLDGVDPDAFTIKKFDGKSMG